ncbi:MAG: branched-chain amino acid aminotransferase [Flavobacteriaceae bacterium]|nr:branched-chain amino acid aminotransferase [Flavobacteriaceae bacterium]MDO7581701.1 branched-chain amino acid aminotransferase [Flavobacteriaceae bacterium]MDO7591461.1 branched-chain amino acid aminotransferase [Flavobacteriaceae bacterium]MDO7598954.1 branched-chain amino acid aminotransferase [Flavobacteriaceae bacterium]MDO7603217.1 branched-chain amino acid aminotransferase [Flavobacteriaceae bacterium]
MKITAAQESKINTVDFDNLKFGEIFTDHMFVCDYADGKWKTPEILPYQPIQMDPSSSVFHYGQAVFEGMKAYKDDADGVWLFRPDQNFNRINKSSERLSMPAFPEKFFFEGLEKLLNLDKEWIKKGTGNSLYVRPFVFASQAGVQATASNAYKFMIICSPVSSYYSGGEVHVQVAEKFSRAASGGVGFAKAAGNYAAQFYPTSLALKEGFQQIIWTDASTHEYLEEAGTMNIFFRINDTLITTPTSDRILDGVTRKSILQLAEHLGIKTEVRPITIHELISTKENGSLKEIFGAGTAVVVSPIKGFGYQNKRYILDDLANSYASLLKEQIVDIQRNAIEDPFGWRHEVK